MKAFLILLLLPLMAIARTNYFDASTYDINSLGTISDAEFFRIKGLTSNAQTQIDGKDDLYLTWTNDTTTGSGATLSSASTTGKRLTAAGTLVSVNMIPAGTNGQRLIILNETGAQFLVSNDTGGTAANRIITGTGGSITIKDKAGLYLVYDTNDSRWHAISGAGGGGGLSSWVTSYPYQVGDVVIESFRIYYCSTAHTSGTFATDLAATKWTELSPVDLSQATGTLALSKGGTNKNFTAVNGGIVYMDADSQEVSLAGTSGQILQSAGAATPTWVNKSILGKQGTSAVTLEELGFPRNKLTTTGANKYLVEGLNLNQFVNPGGEDTTAGQGWSSSTTAPAATYGNYSTSIPPEFGAQSIKLNCNGTSGGAGTCTFYQDVTTTSQVQGIVSAYVAAESGSVVKVYPRINGVKQSSQEAVLIADLGYKYIGFPVVLGSTSTGIQVEVTVGASEFPFVVMDRAFGGPQEITGAMAMVGGWTSFTPTGSQTNTTFTGWHRQVGENREYFIKLAYTGAPVGSMEVNLKSGDVINTSVTPLTTTGSNDAIPGSSASIYDNGTIAYPATVTYSSTTSVRVNPYDASSSYAKLNAGSGSVPVALGNTDYTILSFSVPIVGLSSSVNTYIDQCQTDVSCANEFSAVISSAGVVSGENLDWISGNASVTATSNYAFTWNTGVFGLAPTCVATPLNAAVVAMVQEFTATTTSGGAWITSNYLGSGVAMAWRLHCSRSSTDYKARRQIIGSFQYTPKTLGSSGSDIQSVYFAANSSLNSACTTGTCAIGRQTGNKITSVTWQSTGNYRANGIDGTKYNCTLNGVGADFGACYNDPGGTSTYAAFACSNMASAQQNVQGSIHCIGVP
jgi:hypothetical protein